VTAEQQARDLLERIGVSDAHSYATGDLVELANLIAEVKQLKADADWRNRWHDILGRGAQPEGAFYEALRQRLKP
jgi:hypothetical protein